MTKQEIIERLNKVCEESQTKLYDHRAIVHDREIYRKSCTCFRIVETSTWSKLRKSIDFGYFDNNKGVYVPGKRDLTAETVYDFGGNNVVNF